MMKRLSKLDPWAFRPVGKEIVGVGYACFLGWAVLSSAQTVPPSGSETAQKNSVAPVNPIEDANLVNPGGQSGGRHGGYTKKAAAGPHMKVTAATFFGTSGFEEFVDAGGLPDGMIVAFGNAWGPDFPRSAGTVEVLGRGRHTGQVSSITDKNGRKVPNPDSPDMAGFVVFFGEDLGRVAKAVRFDWGVASISAGRITPDGKGLIIAGRCGPEFGTFLSQTKRSQTLTHVPPAAPPQESANGGRRARQVQTAMPKDAYVARLSATDPRVVEWVWVLEKLQRIPEELFLDDSGQIFLEARGLRKISADGQQMTLVSDKSSTNQAKWLGVHPRDGSVYFGGDRNTNTGREPYRNPFFHKYDASGQLVYTLWNFPSREIGADNCRLVSDSSPRALAWTKDGLMIVSGWSDGGNSVLVRQPTDWRQPIAGKGMGMETSGMKGANSLAHILVIDPETKEAKVHAWWAAFIPTWFQDPKYRGAPNGINIRQIRVLENGSVAITGTSATGLIQTPKPFWIDPMSGAKYGGWYVTVFRPDLSNLMFSSYLPGCENVSLGVTRRGLVVVSRSYGDDAREERPTSSPIWNALQRQFGGGTDAHIVALALPLNEP